MLDHWRNWNWRRYQARVSSSDNFAEFERLFSGAIDPDLASKMPSSLLLDKRSGDVSQETRNIIDSEINRRLDSWQLRLADIISGVALIVSIAAIIRTS